MDRLPIAYHEAGHAVIALRHGVEVKRVTVFPRGTKSGTGLCQFKPELGFLPDLESIAGEREKFEGLVISLLAGPQAELRFRGWEGDSYGLESMSDVAKATEWCERVSRGPDENATYVAWLVERTKNEIGDSMNWDPIKVLAVHLLEHPTVLGTDIRRIVRTESGGSSDARSGSV